MFDLHNELGIKSYSFHAIRENSKVAEAVLQCDVNRVDLSGCHVDYDDPEAQAQTIAIYRDAGIRICGNGVVLLENDEARNRRYFDFARQAGCDVVSASFNPDDHEAVLAMAERLCDEYGMRVALHNHGGTHWLGNATILDYIFRRTGDAIGLCLDTGWCLQAGEDPVKWLERFGQRLYAIHFKDMIFKPNGECYDTIVGENALDLPAILGLFKALPFTGSAVVEYEGEDTVDASRQCVEVIRRCWASLGSSS